MVRNLFLAILLVICLSAAAEAAGPYLVCNAYTGADYFVVTGLPAAIDASKIPPDATGAYGFKLDIGALPAGTYTVRARACSNIWGCSDDSDPFEFARPSLTAKAVAIALTR